MISKPTVLILGAGASVDYKFPTGRELLHKIWMGAREGSPLYKFLIKETENGQKEVKRFADALLGSAAPSVDLFLEQRKDFEQIGKIAIAVTLIPFETYESFRPHGEKARWYETLFQLMVEGGHITENKLSVITFNYDRSLEAFLFQSVKNLYGLDDAKAEEQLQRISIIHLHGTLGDRLTGDGVQRGYDPTVTLDNVQAAVQRIKIVHEAKPGQEFDRALNCLSLADEVIFLGFGFHRVNIERLRLAQAFDFHTKRYRQGQGEQKWLACRTCMGEGDVARAKAFLGNVPVDFSSHQDWDIKTYLSNTACLIPECG
jgi:hypothetical protein